MIDLKELKEKTKSEPENALAHRALAYHNLTHDEFKAAQQSYLKALTYAPSLLEDILLDYERVIQKSLKNPGPRLALAGFYLSLGQLDAAILELEELLDLKADIVEAYNVLGKIYVKQEKIDQTIELLERSIKVGIKDVALTEILAGAYLEKGRVDEAIKFYEELLTARSGDKKILRILGDLYSRLEQYNKAALKYQAMFSDDPEVAREVIQKLEDLLKKLEGNVLIREILADVYMRSLQPELAVNKLSEIIRLDQEKIDFVVKKLKQILKSYPHHPQASLALASTLKTQTNYSEAVEVYYDLVKNQPEYIAEVVAGYREILRFCPDQVLARSYLAEALLFQNKVNQALSQYEALLGMDPSTADLVVRKAKEIIKAKPQLLKAQVVLGCAYLSKGENQKAIEQAEEILNLDRKYAPAYLLLGQAYAASKMCRKALDVLSTALQLAPADLQIQREFKLVKEHELEMQINEIKEKLVQDPWKVSLHLDLAKLYQKKGHKEEAIRELQIVMKDEARAPFAANLLGCIYRGEGRFDLAAAQFNKALEAVGGEVLDFARNIRFNLGTTYEAQGQVKKAIRVYESILQEDIDFPGLKQRIKYLKSSSLNSIRNKNYILAVAQLEKGQTIALWGREAKTGRAGSKDQVNVSFGQKYNLSGTEYFDKGMYKAALEEYQLAVQLDNHFTTALNNLGVALVKEGRFPEAKVRFEEALRQEPNSIVLHNNLGVTALLLGQQELAKEELTKANKIDPETKAVCLNLGDVCYLQQKVVEALDLYKRVGSFDPLVELAQERLRYKVPS